MRIAMLCHSGITGPISRRAEPPLLTSAGREPDPARHPPQEQVRRYSSLKGTAHLSAFAVPAVLRAMDSLIDMTDDRRTAPDDQGRCAPGAARRRGSHMLRRRSLAPPRPTSPGRTRSSATSSATNMVSRYSSRKGRCISVHCHACCSGSMDPRIDMPDDHRAAHEINRGVRQELRSAAAVTCRDDGLEGLPADVDWARKNPARVLSSEHGFFIPSEEDDAPRVHCHACCSGSDGFADRRDR